MMVRLGRVRELTRYPVKSMAGIPTDEAFLGWHGLLGDRRYAFRRLNVETGVPWLTASRLPELLLYRPLGFEGAGEDPSPTHVRTPDGETLELRSAELQRNISERFGHPVELMRLNSGIFDDASVSVINAATVMALCTEAGLDPDPRRFRPNVVIEMDTPQPFAENDWIGGRLVFGENGEGPVVDVQMHDQRCMMINLDPETAVQDPGVMKASVGLNGNNAGIYGAVARTGRLAVGQTVNLIPDQRP